MMNVIGWICNLLEPSPQELADHQRELEDYGIIPYSDERLAEFEREETAVYVNHAPIERDVSYEDHIGHVQHYQIDQHGRRHDVGQEETFYAGFNGYDPAEIHEGEVVDEIVTTTVKGPFSWLIG